MTFQRVQRELTADEIARLHELRAAGERLKELAHEFGVSHQTVSRYLRDLVPKPGRLTKALLETAGDMRRAGVMDATTHAKITRRHLGENS